MTRQDKKINKASDQSQHQSVSPLVAWRIFESTKSYFQLKDYATNIGGNETENKHLLASYEWYEMASLDGVVSIKCSI